MAVIGQAKHRVVLPRQHGAWVMLFTSWLFGILSAGRVNGAALVVLAAAVAVFVAQANCAFMHVLWRGGKKERTMLEIAGIGIMTLLLPATEYAVSGRWSLRTVLLWPALLVFFWGSVLRVRLLLRNRGGDRHKHWNIGMVSVAYHVCALSALACIGGLLGKSLVFPAILLLPATIGSAGSLLKRPTWPPRASLVGLGELLLTVCMIVMAQSGLAYFRF